MKARLLILCILLATLVCGCQKQDDASMSTPSSSAGAKAAGSSTPDVGAVTPAPSTTIDQAAGGGVGSTALKKARGVASEGVGSVNNAQKQGYGSDTDTTG